MVLNEMPVNMSFAGRGREPQAHGALRSTLSGGEDLQIRHRLVVWQTIARLWLVQELNERDLRSIARALADSPFDWSQIERICVYEVAPVVHENLRRERGVGGDFDAAWLLSAIKQNMRNANFRQEALRNREHLMELVRTDWERVKQYVKELRSAPPLSTAEQQGLLRLLQEAELCRK